MSIALSIKNLKKTYDNKLHALKGINLEVKKGDFFALLGSNGAGKTTAIGIVCGLLNKSSGFVEVLGLNQDDNVNAVKKLIGLMPQEFNFNPFDVIEEILINQAGYYGIDKVNAKIRSNILLKKMHLWDKRLNVARSLSGGMKRRLMLARALMHEPQILILDEPTAGVDIEIRRSIWDLLRQLNKDNTTIILTTHYLEEAESLCRSIAILDNGKIIAQNSMQKLLADVGHQALILESTNILPLTIDTDNFTCIRINDYSLQISLKKNVTISSIFPTLSKQNINISHIRSAQNRLETLFLRLTNKSNVDLI